MADAVDLDDRNGLTIPGLGFSEVLLDCADRGGSIGADRGGVAVEAVTDGGLCLGGGGHGLSFFGFGWFCRLGFSLSTFGN